MNAEIIQRLESSFPGGWDGLEAWILDPYNTDNLSDDERRLVSNIRYLSGFPPDKLAKEESWHQIALAAIGEIRRLREMGLLTSLLEREEVLRRQREKDRAEWLAQRPEQEAAIKQDKAEQEIWQNRINEIRAETKALHKKLEAAREKLRLASLKERARNMEIDRDMLSETVKALEMSNDLDEDDA
ncbi:hypothetical protein AD948_04350 [Acetobacter senegalensis]|uniref:Uncharacterized protein n=2 Tax=Acetobacter senegalensis TaxID=446692 RepID=A0A149U5J7_9PROT|nr:hypothetical protein AD948_04350 [Acetobacter senegalensis]